VSSRRRSEAEYARRTNAVVDFIDQHLDQKLELADLAEVAHFSPFHFHRLFHALVGEALGDYIRRRRVEVAATRLLAQLRVPVLDIALGVGFGSAEAFARAFKSRFGCSPSEWRKSKPGQTVGNPDQTLSLTKDKHGGSAYLETTMSKVKIVERQPTHVAYLRHLGAYGPTIGAFWMSAVAPWMDTNNLLGRERFGISLDDPAVTQPSQCRYDACVQSPEGEMLSGDPGRKIIPGGRYASMSFEGTGAQIGAAWESLLRDWLPRSGLQLDARPFFEHYPVDGKYDAKTGAFSCNICVPVTDL
jgi:AraC family transcriptional regulator